MGSFKKYFTVFVVAYVFLFSAPASRGETHSPSELPPLLRETYIRYLNKIVDKHLRRVEYSDSAADGIALISSKESLSRTFLREAEVLPCSDLDEVLDGMELELFCSGFIPVRSETREGVMGREVDVAVYISGIPAYLLRLREKVSARIAIIIDDVGYNNKAVANALRVRCPLDFAVLPKLSFSMEDARILRKSGFEIMLHLPMESYGDKEHHEKVVVGSHMSDGQIKDYINSCIDEYPYIAGVNNHMGSKATQDEKIMKCVLSGLKEHDLFFIDSRTSDETVVESIGSEVGIRMSERNIFIDNKRDPDYIRGQIRKLMKTALSKKEAIGIGHFHPVTLDVIEEMRPEIEKALIKIVFVSELLGMDNSEEKISAEGKDHEDTGN